MSQYLFYEHKHGDTFDFSGAATLENGGTVNMTGWGGESQIREADGTVVEQLTFAWIDASTGTCRVYSGASTVAWPEGRVFFDIQFTTDTGTIVSTPTVTLVIGGDNTA